MEKKIRNAIIAVVVVVKKPELEKYAMKWREKLKEAMSK